MHNVKPYFNIDIEVSCVKVSKKVVEITEEVIMSNDGIETAKEAVSLQGEQNGIEIDRVTKRVVVNTVTLQKMRKVISLFDDELSLDAKEPEIIGFFLQKGFDALVASGEIDRRVKAILG